MREKRLGGEELEGEKFLEGICSRAEGKGENRGQEQCQVRLR